MRPAALDDVPHRARPGRPAATARGREGDHERHPATVLIVDDEPDVVASLVALVEAELDGVRAKGAFSGPQALLHLAHEDVDLVVSDFRMPGMDGLELLDRVRRRWPDIPTVLVSAYADEGLAQQAKQSGHIRMFLPKPLPLDDFLQALRQIIG